MFEDFRKQSENASFPDEEPDELALKSSPKVEGYFLGLTPPQRFIVAVMLLIMTVILGVLFLLVTSRIYPPFLL